MILKRLTLIIKELMKSPNPDFELRQVSECVLKLQALLEGYGMDVFAEAVTELFNSHPLTAPNANCNKEWFVLMLPVDCDLEGIIDSHDYQLASTD